MTKSEFLKKLEAGLTRLSSEERQERLNFYSEMIDDRMEEGLSEEDAVAAIGSVEQILRQIAPPDFTTSAPQRSFPVWAILLLILGSPLWLSLLITAFAVVFSLVASVLAVVVSLWAVFGSMVSCTIGCVISGIALTCFDNTLTGLAVIATSLLCGSLSIFLFFACKALTNISMKMIKISFTQIKKWIKGKEKTA